MTTTTWVALLRGVNVGGVTIRSADLAALFTDELGFAAVRTIVASGNVRFDSDTAASGRAALKERIEQALRRRFGYDAWIVLITLDELREAVTGFPFDAGDAGRQPYVVFASDAGALRELKEAAAGLHAEADPVQVAAAVLYWNPVKGTTLQTPFAKVLGKAKYKSTTTNRNLRTLVKILG